MKTTTRILLYLIICQLLLLANAHAEMKTFIRDYTYQASEVDSKQSCRIIATEQVKRLLLEELGTYLESHTEVVDSELTKDQITTLTAGVVKTQIVKESWNGQEYWLQAKLDADPDEVAASITRLSKDRQKVRDLENNRKMSDNTMKDIDKLKKEMEIDKDNPNKTNKYNEKVQSLKVIQGMAGAFKAINEGKPVQGIGAVFEMMGDIFKNSTPEEPVK